MRRPTLLSAIMLAALLAAMAFKSALVQPPPVREHAVAGEFDAKRAKSRLATVLGDQRPHTSDTEADDLVRGRIVAQLEQLGLTPVIRDQLACNELYKQRGVACARVRNVLAVMGPLEGKAVMLNAHYDSTPVGPAAADDGAGVATLLEVAANLKDKPLKRPVILLFNEGEELGLVGARAFLADPLSRNVDSLINLEARGVRGPVNMFETSRPNGASISVFKQSVAHPIANSLSTDVYRLMPNYTDVNSFAERGWLTLNLAPIGNETRYHSAGDDIAALDAATLQHMGDQTLALTERLANGRPSDSADQIFMDVAGRVLITLPLLTGAVLLVGLIVAFLAFSIGRGGLSRGVAVTVGTIACSAGVSWIFLALIGLVRHGMFWRAHPAFTNLATYASVILVAVLLLSTFGRRVDVRQLRPGFWFVYLVIGGVVGLIAPGGIIFFLFPPIIVLAGMLVERWWKAGESIASALAILALYLTWGAMLGLLEELLNSGPMWAFAPLGTLIILPVLIETKGLLEQVGMRHAAFVTAAVTLVGWLLVAVAPAYSADRQLRFSLEHVTDARTGKSLWSVQNGATPLPAAYRDGTTWRWAKLPYSERKRWLADAPAAAGVKAPQVEPVGVIQNGKQRTISLRLRSNGAERIALVAPEDARIRAAGTTGFVRPIDSAVEEGEYSISCSGRSCDGMTLQVITDNPKPIEFIVLGARSALSPSARPLIAARPQFARPQYSPDQSITFSRVRL